MAIDSSNSTDSSCVAQMYARKFFASAARRMDGNRVLQRGESREKTPRRLEGAKIFARLSSPGNLRRYLFARPHPSDEEHVIRCQTVGPGNNHCCRNLAKPCDSSCGIPSRKTRQPCRSHCSVAV